MYEINFKNHNEIVHFKKKIMHSIFVSLRTDEDSFQKVKNWVKELRKMLGSEISLAIVGNKIDLNKDRVVPLEMAEK